MDSPFFFLLLLYFYIGIQFEFDLLNFLIFFFMILFSLQDF